MDLKTLCLNNIVELIKNLPPQLQEEVIGISTKAIKEEAEKNANKKIMKEMKRSAVIVTDDITRRIIKADMTGDIWRRPEYTHDMDDELYYTLVDVAENFVSNNRHLLIFPNNNNRRETIYWPNRRQSSSEEEEEEY